MKAQEVYKVFDNYKYLFSEHGFNKSKSNTYVSNNNIKLQIILDKWGWSSDDGWGFNIRLYDLNKIVDAYGNVHPNDQLDLKPYYFLEKGKITDKDVELIYGSSNNALKTEFLEGFWYKFSSENDLQSILKSILPIILNEASDWRN